MNWNKRMNDGIICMEYDDLQTRALQGKSIPEWAKAESAEMCMPLNELWGLSDVTCRKTTNKNNGDLPKELRYNVAKILYKMADQICPEQLKEAKAS